MLTMSIPDEVAQYAEGHRITAYLPLGEVKEKGKDTVETQLAVDHLQRRPAPLRIRQLPRLRLEHQAPSL